MPLNVLRVLEQLEITLPPTSAASSHRQAAETHLEHAREELEKLTVLDDSARQAGHQTQVLTVCAKLDNLAYQAADGMQTTGAHPARQPWRKRDTIAFLCWHNTASRSSCIFFTEF